MTESIWVYNERCKVRERRGVIIIGGGIAGLSVSYWLSLLGVRATVLEERSCGLGATSRNIGFVLAGLGEFYSRFYNTHGKEKANGIWNLTIENGKLLQEFINKNNFDCEHTEYGGYALAMTERELAELKESVDLLCQNGFDYKLLDYGQTCEVAKSKIFLGAKLGNHDFKLNSYQLVQNISRIIQSDGCSIIENCRVLNIENKNYTVEIETTKGFFEADMVVLATNAYSPLLLDYFKDKVFPVRGQVLATEPVKLFLHHPFTANFEYEYFTQSRNGEVVMGGMRWKDENREIGYVDEVTDIVQNNLYDFLMRAYPELNGIRIKKRWSGIMGFTCDGFPIVGPIPHLPQVYAMCGMNAHGMGLSFALGKMVSELMIKGRSDLFMDFLSIKRFN